jgi:hypothetical protein
MRRWLLIPLMLLFASPAAAGPIFLGTNTLSSADDLTVMKCTSGQTWEWLDLTSTLGLSVEDALDAYAPQGFHSATGGDVAELYGAFGITYRSTPGGSALLGNIPQQDVLMGYLGITLVDFNPFLRNFAAIGWIDDFTTDSFHTYSCISNGLGGCGFVQGAVSNFEIAEPRTSKSGTYLVREVAVPEPSSGLLLLLGILAVATYRQSRRATDG